MEWMMVLAAALLSALQVATTPNECSADVAVVQRVTAVANSIIEADNARDLGGVKAVYAPDAVLLPPNESPVHGWAAIQPRYEALFAGFDPAIVGHIDQVCVSGRIAYVRGRNTGQMRGRGNNASRVLNDAYVMLLRLDTGPGWRISHLIWHSAGPASP
jgi:ketosteroid isomerase-like protein